MAVSATQIPGCNLCFTEIHQRRNLKLNTSKKLLGVTGYDPFGLFTRKREFDGCFILRALDPQKETEENSSLDKDTNAFASQEDLAYLSKLVGGSVVGAAAIKYGSALFPEITRPNIVVALIMISTPVLVAVLLLIKESRLDMGE